MGGQSSTRYMHVQHVNSGKNQRLGSDRRAAAPLQDFTKRKLISMYPEPLASGAWPDGLPFCGDARYRDTKPLRYR